LTATEHPSNASSVSDPALLKPYQRRIAAGGVTAVSVAVIGMVLFGVLWLLRLFVVTFANVIWPLVVASILAVLLRPVVDVFATRLRLGRIGAVVMLYVLVVVTIAVGILLLLPVVITEAINVVELTPLLLENARSLLEQANPELAAKISPEQGLGPMLTGLIPELRNEQDLVRASVPALQQLQELAIMFLAVATGVAIIPVYLFFLLIDDSVQKVNLDKQLSFLKPQWRQDILYLVEEFANAIIAFFRGQILIGLIMGALLAVGFWFADLRFAVIFGLALGILNIIPYLGTILGLATPCPWRTCSQAAASRWCWPPSACSWPCRSSRATCSPRGSWATPPACIPW